MTTGEKSNTSDVVVSTNAARLKGRGFRPAVCFDSVTVIPPSFFTSRGITAVILDVDNTINRWELIEVPVEIIAWIRSLEDAGLKLAILSNGIPAKVQKVKKQTGLTVVAGIKPFISSFIRAREFLGVADDTIAMIGDQCVTDIWPANRLGWTTILVEPMSRHEFPGTYFYRLAEKIFGMRKPIHPGIGA